MRTVQEGDRGAIVELLQWGLARTGTCTAAIDGIFGPQTAEAVKCIQGRHGLEQSGIADAGVWKALHPWLAGYHVHQVGKGDALPQLAARYGSRPEAILTANPGVRRRRLCAGETLTIPMHAPVVPTHIRWSSDLLALVLEGLCARYPFLQRSVIGSSVLCRPLHQITIGRGRRRVGYNAAHHANEWITTPVLLQFLEQYAQGVAQGGTLGGLDCRRLFDRCTLDLVPMVNPDGVDLVTGALEEDSPAYRGAKAIAEGFPAIPFPSGWKANIKGYDLNLAYPAQWEQAKELKFAQGFCCPAPRDYVGEAPLSPLEARAMYLRTLWAGYRLILAYHTQGKLIFWKFDDFHPKGAEALVRKMERVSGYRAEVTPAYSANAGYKDWFIQQFNRPGYTIEAGIGQNPLPLHQFDDIYRDNLGILLLGLTGGRDQG